VPGDRAVVLHLRPVGTVLRYNSTIVFNYQGEPVMGQPVVHFEIIGTDPQRLRSYYGQLFGWEFDTSGTTSESISAAGNYGFVENPDGAGIPGGIGGGTNFSSHVIFYVGVPDVEAALRQAENLGGKRVMGPEQAPGSLLVVGHFTDIEGHLIGVAGTA
jgi:predicted enzyme related to lactoylglutathione lyase